jgi:hypothetical protein
MNARNCFLRASRYCSPELSKTVGAMETANLFLNASLNPLNRRRCSNSVYTRLERKSIPYLQKIGTTQSFNFKNDSSSDQRPTQRASVGEPEDLAFPVNHKSPRRQTTQFPGSPSGPKTPVCQAYKLDRFHKLDA